MKSLPKEFLSRWEQIFGSHFPYILSAFSLTRFGSFRVNTLKTNEKEIVQNFEKYNIPLEKFHFFENIFLFDKKFEYQIKGTDEFYSGKIYLQSVASMLPVLALNPQKWEKILDVCAAPGGKTTQIAMMQQNEWEVTAIEKNQIRFDKLAYNVKLQNANNIILKKMDAKNFFKENTVYFDRILLDAPCSAEGRFNIHNEKSFGFWSMKNILQKAELQTELLDSAWKFLKKWWSLVYSTCTLAPEENECVVKNFLEKYSDAQLEKIDFSEIQQNFIQPNIDSFQQNDFWILQKRAVRIFPSIYTEWFFIAKIVKK